MMIDVRKCNAERKYTGTLDFEFEGDASLIDIPFVSFSTPVHAVLDYEIFEDNSVEVKGELSFTLEGACSRCLKPTKEHIVSEAEALFVPKGGKAEEEFLTYTGIMGGGEAMHAVKQRLDEILNAKAAAQTEDALDEKDVEKLLKKYF